MQDLQNFFTDHPGALMAITALVASGLDFVFAIKPEWKSNGLLHFLYLQVTKKTDAPK